MLEYQAESDQTELSADSAECFAGLTAELAVEQVTEAQQEQAYSEAMAVMALQDAEGAEEVGALPEEWQASVAKVGLVK